MTYCVAISLADGLVFAWSENIRAAFEGLPGPPLAALETARVARIA